jgi:hypothetical protein
MEAPLRRTALGLALLWVVLAGVFVQRLQGRGFDDFFITYRYAQNLTEGNGFVFNPGERVFGTTAPGMGLLLAAGHWITRIPIHWLGTLSTGLALIAIALLVLLEAAPHGRLLEAAIGGTLLVSSTILWACHGAEGPVVLVLLLLAARWGRDRPWLAGLVAGLAVWCRPDAGLGVGLLGLLLWTEGRRLPWRYGVAAGLVIGLGAAAAFGYFGHVLPNTWTAKQASVSGLGAAAGNSGSRFWLAALPFLRRHLGPLLPLVLLLGAAGQVPLFREAGRPGRLLVLYSATLAIAYPLLGVSFASWYSIPVVSSLLPGVAFAIGSLTRRTRFRLVATAGLLAIVAASVVPSAISWFQGADKLLHFEGYRAAGLWIQQDSRPEDGISFVEVGTLAYFSRRPVEDLMGLVTPGSIPFVREGNLLGAFLAKPTRYVVVRPSLQGFTGQITSRRWFRRRYEEVARFLPDSSDWIAVYRLK